MAVAAEQTKVANDTTTQQQAPQQPPANQELATVKEAKLVVVDDSSFENLLDTARFEHIWRVAKVFAASGMVPKQYAGKPEACFVACQMAIRLSVDPMMFMQNTYMSPDGKPAMYGQLAIALVNARGPFSGPIQFEIFGVGDEHGCRAYATHRTTGQICEMTVTVAMAKAEGWYGRNPKWKNIQDLMLRYRAGAWLARVFAPECLLGMQTAEEVEDVHGELHQDETGTYRPAPPRPTRDQFRPAQPAAQTQETDAQAETAHTDPDAPLFELVDNESVIVCGTADPAKFCEAFIELMGHAATRELLQGIWDTNSNQLSQIAEELTNPVRAAFTHRDEQLVKAKTAARR